MSFQPLFSHIYVEEQAQDYPLCKKILGRFPKATCVGIQSYKEVFNRPRQRWDHQQHTLKLILAVRDDAFLYPGSSFVPNFQHTRFFYTTPALNCLYGCEYCYLQGMFPSANVVVFVNSSDFTDTASQQLQGPDPAYLCISYDTDLLAFEDILGYCSVWTEFARNNPHVTLEIRTKSAHSRFFREVTPVPNVIIAWTLSPEQIIATYEHKTPRLASRLAAMRVAQECGWKVRICYDPVLPVSGWRSAYAGLVETTFASVDPKTVHDISIGVFRIPSGYLRVMQESNPGSKLLHHPFTIRNGSASHSPEEYTEVIDHVSQQLAQHVSQEKICPVPWQS